MKKSYIIPATKVVSVKIENVLQTASKISVGENISSGSAASREGGRNSNWDDED